MDTVSISEPLFVNLVRNVKYAQIIDENSSIIVSATDDESLTSEAGWAVVCCNGRKFYRFVTYTVSQHFQNTIILTNTNLYNLNVCSVALTKPPQHEKLILSDRSRKFSPKYALSAKICSLQNADVENSAVDLCLKNYFSTSRYLHAADIICIDVSLYSPELLYSKWNLRYVYFKIDLIEGPPFDDCDVTCGYFINTEYTTVHLVSPTSCYVPILLADCNNTDIGLNELEESMYSIVPDGFDELENEIQKMVAPFLQLEPCS